MKRYEEKALQILSKKQYSNVSEETKKYILKSEHNSEIFYRLHSNVFKDFCVSSPRNSKHLKHKYISFALVTNKGDIIRINSFISNLLNLKQNEDLDIKVRVYGFGYISDVLESLINKMHGNKTSCKIDDLIRKANCYCTI